MHYYLHHSQVGGSILQCFDPNLTTRVCLLTELALSRGRTWLLLIYSFQFSSTAGAAPARAAPDRYSPTLLLLPTLAEVAVLIVVYTAINTTTSASVGNGSSVGE